MKKLLVCIGICLCLVGCGKQESQTEISTESSTENNNVTSETLGNNEVENDKLATRQFIIDYFDLDESDFAHIDVEGVIEYYQITEEGIKSSSNVVAKLEWFEQEMIEAKGKMGDFSYLFEGEPISTSINKDEIIYIAYLYGENTRNDYWFIDVGDSKVYYSLGADWAVSEPEMADEEATLDANELNDILQSIEDGEINNWKPIYEGNDGDTTGSTGWRIDIQLEDGTVISYRGWGMFGENRPQELDAIEQAIFALGLRE